MGCTYAKPTKPRMRNRNLSLREVGKPTSLGEQLHE